MKKILLTCLICIYQINFVFSQCINPTPTGDIEQTFCKKDLKTVADLVVSGGNVVWYNQAVAGKKIDNASILITGKYYADDISGGSCSTSRLEVSVFVYGKAPDTLISITECSLDVRTVSELFAVGENIEWYDKETNGNLINPNNLILDGVTYWAQQTENGCVSKRSPTTVYLSVVGPPIVEDPIQTFCDESNPTIANLQASVDSIDNTILWYYSKTSTVPIDYTETLENNHTYWATQITDMFCESEERVAVTAVIDKVENPGINTQHSICEIDVTQFNLFDVLEGNPEVDGVWTGPSSLGGGYLGEFNPSINVEGEYTYTLASELGVCPSKSATVTIIIIKPTKPSTSNTTQFFCELDNSTIANIDVTGTNIKWYSDATSTIPLAETDVLVEGKDYFASQTNEVTNCESVGRLKVTVQFYNTPIPTTTNSTQTFCELDNPTIANIDVTGTSIKWYSDATSTSPLAETVALVEGEDYYASQTNETTNCESVGRLKVTVQFYNTPIPTTSNSTQTFCELDNPTIANIDVTGTSIKWYSDATSTSPLAETIALVEGEDYYASQTNETTNCESVGRLKVTVEFYNTPTPTTSNSTQSFCELDNSTIANLDVSGTNIKWYSDATSTEPLAETELLIDGEDYYASQTNETTNCESSNRLQIYVELIETDLPTITSDGNLLCSIDQPTLAELSQNINIPENHILTWYTSYSKESILNFTELLQHNTTYYAVLQNSLNGCESTPLEIEVYLDNCGNDDIEIYDGFSPDGDGINDNFNIKNINELYPDYAIEFFNRWGNSVYQGNINKPSWNGRLYGNKELLPVGVYYYVLHFNKNDRKPIQGTLYLNRFY